MEMVIKGNTYSIGKMPLDTQLHVARRLAPLVYAMSAGLLSRLQSGEVLSSGDDPVSMLRAIEPVVAVISSMNDADCNYVVASALAVCQRRTGEGPGSGFQVVRAPGSSTMQFADIDLTVMLKLVYATVRDNLENFFLALTDFSETENSPQAST